MSFIHLSSSKFSAQENTTTQADPNDQNVLVMEKTNSLLSGTVFFHSQLSISVSSVDMTFYWKRCDVLAKFISQFYFHSYDAKQLDKNAISTIINELVENASKYSEKENSKIFIEIKDLGTHLRVEVKNKVSPWIKAIFENKMQTIQSGNIEQMYFDALESRNNGSGSQGLGLLMLLKDYQLELAYEFSKIDESSYEVTMRVHIPVDPCH